MQIDDILSSLPYGQELNNGKLIYEDSITKKFQIANPIVGGRAYNMQDFHGRGPSVTINQNGSGEVESRTHSNDGGHTFNFRVLLVNAANQLVTSAPISTLGEGIFWGFGLPDNGSWAYWTPSFTFPLHLFSEINDCWIWSFVN